MASILKVDTIQDQSGNNIINENADTITIGASGDTIVIPSGATYRCQRSDINITYYYRSRYNRTTIRNYTLTLGASGDTITIPSGASMTVPSGGLSGQNYPAFEAYLSATQTISELTITKITVDTEVFDTDSCYDNTTNYRFTPNVAGKYMVYVNGLGNTPTNGNMAIVASYIYKNETEISTTQINTIDIYSKAQNVSINIVVDFNGTTDYVDFRMLCNTLDDTSPTITGAASARRTWFGAYRIGA
jgi:hypothetical protein